MMWENWPCRQSLPEQKKGKINSQNAKGSKTVQIYVCLCIYINWSFNAVRSTAPSTIIDTPGRDGL